MATVVLAGGGTAGHVEPALAVAREWLKTNPSDTCIFLGTKSGLENTLVPAAGFELRVIPKVTISRKPSASWLRIPIDLISSVLSSMKVLRNADVLIGFGGYVLFHPAVTFFPKFFVRAEQWMPRPTIRPDKSISQPELDDSVAPQPIGPQSSGPP